ncbi:MAG: helix-turn-helix domain-containing protein [Spirochaetaceae bacterium]|nr:helix-turn-helix domain-containing protein [Spirochaetaceae bacterium]
MLYSRKDAARLLSVSTMTITRAIAKGELKGRQIGGVVRFNREDLETFIGGRFMEEWETPEVPETPKKGHIIPPGILKSLEKELEGISHGTVTLAIHIRDGRPRFVIGRQRSFLHDAEETKAQGGNREAG